MAQVLVLTQSKETVFGSNLVFFTITAPLPLLVTAATKTADIDQLFYNIFHSRLTPAELSYIYTMIENEKTRTLLWLRNMLPPNLQYPEILTHFALGQ